MFRLTHFLADLLEPPLAEIPKTTGRRRLPGPVVIWNLIRRCNLTCLHCYTTSADIDFPGELTTSEVLKVMNDLWGMGVRVLILSGGEPLLRPDIYEISATAKKMGFYVGLSSNGTLITPESINHIHRIGYDYVGISIDGIGETHDTFRQLTGSFDASIKGLRLCHQHGIKVGLRFTLTQNNAKDIDSILELMDHESVDKFYLSHLNYGGRGNRNRSKDAVFEMTREVMTRLFEVCLARLKEGRHQEFVTGNNDADGVFLLHWIQKNYPSYTPQIKAKLTQWGGNASGVNIANIDNLGHVHPDTFWWHHSLGNVRERPFADIWNDTNDPLMAGLKANDRPLKGRCGSCGHQAICNGNTRVRAHQMTGDAWSEDPGCYLTDQEIKRIYP